jgi:hypothetical protein
VAFRFIAGNEHPDHDTFASFRRRLLEQIEALFVEVLSLAREIEVLKVGTVALDGTKIYANASRHSALSYEHAGKIEAQLKAEVGERLAKTEAADHVADGMSIPEQLARREKRLAKLAEARAKIEARAKQCIEREQAEHQAKLAKRAAKAAVGGKKPGGRPSQPPLAGPLPSDQINLMDDESRIMPVAGGGFEQCYVSRRWWRQTAFWWWPTMWCRQPMTSSSLDRWWSSSRLCQTSLARSKRCWPTMDISAPPTSPSTRLRKLHR